MQPFHVFCQNFDDNSPRVFSGKLYFEDNGRLTVWVLVYCGQKGTTFELFCGGFEGDCGIFLKRYLPLT
jgi:hypothetical protein